MIAKSSFFIETFLEMSYHYKITQNQKQKVCFKKLDRNYFFFLHAFFCADTQRQLIDDSSDKFLLIFVKLPDSPLQTTHLQLTFYDFLNIFHCKQNEFFLVNRYKLNFYMAKYQRRIQVFFLKKVLYLLFNYLNFLHLIRQ